MAERWRHDIGDVHPMAPTIDNGLVYAGGRALVALDLQTGAERWRVAARQPGPDGSIVISENMRQALVQSFGEDPANWPEIRVKHPNAFSTTPLIADGIVYAGTTHGGLFAVRADTGSLVWADDESGMPFISKPSVIDDRMWAGSINKRQSILHLQTGAFDWEFKAFALVLASVAVHGGMILFADEGTVFALPVEMMIQGRDVVAWEQSYYLSPEGVGEEFDGIVYFRDAFPIVGEEQPECQITPLAGSDALYLAARDVNGAGYLASVKFEDGAINWIHALGMGNDPFVVAGESLILSEGDGVAAYDRQTGEPRWRTRTGLAAAPAVANGAVYAGIRDEERGGALVVLDLDDGRELARIDVPTVEGLGAPAVADGVVVVGSVNLDRAGGWLFAFDDPRP